MDVPAPNAPEALEQVPAPGVILVVDDSATARAAAAAPLSEQGHTVLDCRDGAEVLTALENNPQVELILCDLEMPGLDGLELLKVLAARRVLSKHPVIMLSAVQDLDSMAQCLEAGAVDFIRKPFFAPELLIRVRNLLSLSRANNRLAALAFQDPLTGLFNHRVFSEMLGRSVARSLRRKSPLGLIMADLDLFKRVNDTYGHPVGDQVLKEFARRASGQIRLGDLLSRYGGEEFAIIAADADLAASVAVAERVRAVLREPIPTAKGDIQISVSLGVAVLDPHLEQAAGQLVERADQALYQAKDQGRDRVVCAG
jgi:two-component system cell cycle response regulator